MMIASFLSRKHTARSGQGFFLPVCHGVSRPGWLSAPNVLGGMVGWRSRASCHSFVCTWRSQSISAVPAAQPPSPRVIAYPPSRSLSRADRHRARRASWSGASRGISRAGCGRRPSRRCKGQTPNPSPFAKAAMLRGVAQGILSSMPTIRAHSATHPNRGRHHRQRAAPALGQGKTAAFPITDSEWNSMPPADATKLALIMPILEHVRHG